jgi:hypothetical protein
MAIDIINPRRVAVALPCTKKGPTYQVDKILRSFLTRRGWTLMKVGRSYATMTPSDGTKAPFVFDVDIPTPDQVVAVAKERHVVQEPWAGKFGEWLAIYIPPRGWTTTKMDPVTGKPISKPEHGGIIPASFCVGFRLFWHAEVLFQNGEAAYYESESQPIQLQLQLQPTGFVSPDEIPSTVPLVEGAACRITVNAYERSPEARRQCIEAHGTRCCICGFNFGAVYGAEAEGYIHIHHIRRISEIGGEYIVDPVLDLRPVCPNCHAVLHLGGRCGTIEEVRQLLEQQGHA